MERLFAIPPHPIPNFCRIAEIDVLYVRPKGEGHGCPESLPHAGERRLLPLSLGEGFSAAPSPDLQIGRVAEIDVLHVRPKGEGHGCPESLPLKGGEGILGAYDGA